MQFLTNTIARNSLISLFIVLGLSLILVRYLYTGTNYTLNEDIAWRITLVTEVETQEKATILSSPRPKSSRYNKVISQRLYHPDFRILIAKQAKKGYIRARAINTVNTQFLIEYHLQISRTPHAQVPHSASLTTEEREIYIQSNDDINLTEASLIKLNEYLAAGSSSKPELINKLFNYSKKLIKDKNKHYDHLQNIIEPNKATTLGRSKLLVALCRMNLIPARLVTGFVLNNASIKEPYHWVQIYDEEKGWLSYDPEKGYEIDVPLNYITFSYDSTTLFEIENGKIISEKFSIYEDSEAHDISLLQQEGSILDIFELRRLDFETRQALTKILVLPICVLLTVFFRHVLGLFPYGTFTAALLALAMVYAEPGITLILSGIVIFLALLGRSLLPKTMARSPRLSIIFAFVAIGTVISVSTLNYFSINPGGSVILIPTIILVAIVDRFYAYMDEAGPNAALVRLGVTVFIALFCIPLLTFDALGNFILAYPEAHFITIALVLLLSSYKGKKLTNLKLLSLLGENKPAKTSSRKKNNLS